MKVFVAGASGAIGIPLVRQLISHDHEVLGLTRDASGVERLRRLGVTPIVADALDRDAVLRAVEGYTADAIVNELTALKKPPLRHSGMALTNRLRIDGTANLLAAGEVLGARRFVTQSFLFGYGYRDHGARMLDETAPFGVPAGNKADPHVAAMRSTEEQAFTAPEGIALRYGLLYGGDAPTIQRMLARRRLPVTKGGLLSWVHHDDAAAATVAAVERGRGGEAYNIADDVPVSFADMVAAMANALGTPRPFELPGWLFRVVAPLFASIAENALQLSNAKAKSQLGWSPRYASYREGVAAMAESLGLGYAARP